MRMVNDLDQILSVQEIEYIGAVPGWTDKDSSKTSPELFIVQTYGDFGDGVTTLGEYRLNGTKKVFQAAIENFNKICLKAAEKGYFCLSDFENFDFV